uniref:Uncharacterized protein n=1 Tax=Biomphalaria glabrata TaxID=6526 RepID=A0A2C9LVM1_BIOGL
MGLHDPNAPENRRALVTPSALPEAKQEASQAITRGLLALASSGELKTRQDVTEALESAGFEVVRTTKSSISIADPDGGRNIRLKGAIYEQSFNAGEGLRAEIESAAAEYRRDAESRIQRARAVCQSGTERKREENQRRHPRPRPEAVLSHEPAHERDAAYGQPDVADHRPGLSAANRLERGHSVVAESADTRQLHDHPGAEGRAGETERADVGREVSGRQPGALSGAAGRRESGHELDVRQRQEERHQTGAGVEQHDGAGKTVAERIRAATAGLLAKAGRMGERLRGMAEDVWSYATGERGAERARHKLESAGGALERATESFEPVVQRHEYEVAAARARVVHEQHEKELVKEREYPMPRL